MAYNKIANQFTSIEQLSQQYLKNKSLPEKQEKLSCAPFGNMGRPFLIFD